MTKGFILSAGDKTPVKFNPVVLHAFFVICRLRIKLNLSKISSVCLDLNQTQRNAGPDHSPNCVLRLSAENKSPLVSGGERVNIIMSPMMRQLFILKRQFR